MLLWINRGSWSHDNHNNCTSVKPSSTRNLKNAKQMLLCTPLPHMSITLASNSNMSCWSWASPLSSSWLGQVLGCSHLCVRTSGSGSLGRFREPPWFPNFIYFFPFQGLPQIQIFEKNLVQWVSAFAFLTKFYTASF